MKSKFKTIVIAIGLLTAIIVAANEKWKIFEFILTLKSALHALSTVDCFIELTSHQIMFRSTFCR